MMALCTQQGAQQLRGAGGDGALQVLKEPRLSLALALPLRINVL